jgi:hypothetical protein
MKFNFKLNENCSNSSDSRRLHKNLFLDEGFSHVSNVNDDDDDFNSKYYTDEFDNDYEEQLENSSKYYKLNNFSMPLTETIAEFVEELSDEKFILNDLSFIFEMARKRAISPYVMIVALMYLNRLKVRSVYSKQQVENWSSYSSSCLVNSYFKTTSSSFTNTELCLISILLASKYLVDEGESEEIYNNEWAVAADMSVKKINMLEKEFLKKLDWNLFVSSNEFWKFTNDLTEKITRKKIKTTGQCTYSDLDCLFNTTDISLAKLLKCIDFIYKITFVCSSTLVYVLMSSLFVSSCVFSLRNQILNQINMMSKFNSLSGHDDALNASYVNTNESVSSEQLSLNLNELTNSKDTLNYLIIDQIQTDSSENTSETNFSTQSCFLNGKLNQIRLSVQDFFGFNTYDARHKSRMKTGLLHDEHRSIQFMNSYHHNMFQIMT